MDVNEKPFSPDWLTERPGWLVICQDLDCWKVISPTSKRSEDIFQVATEAIEFARWLVDDSKSRGVENPHVKVLKIAPLMSFLSSPKS